MLQAMYMVRLRSRLGLLVLGVLLHCMVVGVQAQSPLLIYTDSLVNGFQDWSWAARNFNNTLPVRSGSNSISVTASAWQALSFWHADLNAAIYSNLAFWANGGASGRPR